MLQTSIIPREQFQEFSQPSTVSVPSAPSRSFQSLAKRLDAAGQSSQAVV